jgi:uncharacterized membrane protein
LQAGENAVASGSVRNWHQQHVEGLTTGQRVADGAARAIGSWTFILTQTALVALWVILNVAAGDSDHYPSSCSTSCSVRAATPGRSSDGSEPTSRASRSGTGGFRTNVKAEREIEDLQRRLGGIEETLGRIEKALERS